MVRAYIFGLGITCVAASRRHVDIQSHNSEELEVVAVTQAVNCSTAWDEGNLPDDCPLPAYNSTTGSYMPAETCPGPCQTYFTRVVDSCSDGDTYQDIGIALHYSEYTLWTEFHDRYSQCNLGVTPSPCFIAWNEGNVPSDCPTPHFNYSTMARTPLETCPGPCQAYFDRVMETCSVGDTYQHSGGTGLTMPTWAQYRLWGEFRVGYPACNLGYTATACTTSMNAVEDAATRACDRAANSPCSADCRALFEDVRTNCATGQATFVPTCCEGSNSYTEQSWTLSHARLFHFGGIFDDTCVALLENAGGSGGGSGSTPGAAFPLQAGFVPFVAALATLLQ